MSKRRSHTDRSGRARMVDISPKRDTNFRRADERFWRQGTRVGEASVSSARLPRPVEALDWAARAIGRGATVGRVHRLRGGTSTTMHAVDISDRSGNVHRLVLRRYVLKDWLAEEPDLAEREARTLVLLAASKVPAPELVAVDPHGEACGVPTVLMTRLAGRVILAPDDMSAWLRGMAEVLPAVHNITVGSAAIQPFQPYYDVREIGPPRWSRQPQLWERALEIARRPASPSESCFIHRDYHPANILWSRGKLSGVVDWEKASIGPPLVDVAHCRFSLALLHGVRVADAFLDAYKAATGLREYDSYWDLTRLFDDNWAEEPRVWEGWTDLGVRGLTTRLMKERLEEFVSRAVALY